MGCGKKMTTRELIRIVRSSIRTEIVGDYSSNPVTFEKHVLINN